MKDPPTDAVWVWKAGGYPRSGIVFILLFIAAGTAVAAIVGGGVVALLVLGLLVVTCASFGLAAAVRRRHTWAAVTPDGKLLYRGGRTHTQLDLRQGPQVHVVRVTHSVTRRGGTDGPVSSTADFIHVGSGPPPTRDGQLDVRSLSGSYMGPKAMYIPVAGQDGLVEAMRPFAEVITIAGRVHEANSFGKTTIDYFPDWDG